MTAVQKRRIRRKRRFVRNTKRIIVSILLAPARMPRVTAQLFEQLMKASEVTGIVFVAVLMMHLFNPVLIKTPIVVMAALMFIGCLLTLKLGDYQDRLEEMKYYGFNI